MPFLGFAFVSSGMQEIPRNSKEEVVDGLKGVVTVSGRDILPHLEEVLSI
jgi:hypothetical protein